MCKVAAVALLFSLTASTMGLTRTAAAAPTRAGQGRAAKTAPRSSDDGTGADASAPPRTTRASDAVAADRALLGAQLKQQLVHLAFANGAVGLHRGAHEEGLGHWGQYAPDLLQGSAAAQAAATSFYHYRLAGRLLEYTAIASYLADIVYLSYAGAARRYDARTAGVAYGLFGGGIVLSIVGSVLHNVAYNRLGRAVVLENESVVDHVLAPPAQASLFLTPTQGGVAAGATVTF